MAKKVLVGMSGGVDSAACVLLLQKQGYDVSGVTLRLHHYKDRPGTCGSADDIEEAARVAAQMGISLPKAYELVKSEDFPSVRIGTRILIPVDAFREWLVITSNKKE